MTALRECLCGHGAADHGVVEPGCSARCLCDVCAAGTRNDCWCAGYKPIASGGE